MTIPFGLNLSFCVKRWVAPTLWAEVIAGMDVDLVQFSFDLVDPMWPDALLDRHASETAKAASGQGIKLHSAFIGLAHYTFNQLLHPDQAVRDYAEQWLMRAYRFAANTGITRVGGPLGAVASRIDCLEPDAIPAADYADLVTRLRRLAEAGKREGLTELYIEPTPMRREWPWTIAQSEQLAADLTGSAVPWKYCLDWGHGTFEPLYGRFRARMEPWYEALGQHIGAIHIQQSDYQYDRHWDFTEKGAVDPQAVAAIQRKVGLSDRPVFLEVFYPFERDDASVLNAVIQSVAKLKPIFADEVA